MSVVPQNFQSYLNTLRILFVALLVAQIVALGIFFSMPLPEGPSLTPEEKKLIKPIVLSVLAMLGAAAFFLHRKTLAAARDRASLPEKLGAYRTALLMRWGPMEAACILLGVVYFVTGVPFFFYLAGLVVVLFGMQWPNQLDVVHALRLNSTEQAILDDPEATVADISQRP